MAGAHCATATTFLLPFANATPIPRRPLASLSSISTPSPSRLTKRKNYLRPKLLKTLAKPYPNPLLPQSPPTIPIIPIESPHEQQPDCPSDQFAGEVLKESEASTSVGVIDGSIGNFSRKSALKFGLYLVGAFLFQTICAVWILGSANSDYKDGNLDSEDKKARVSELGVGGNHTEKSNLLLNGIGNSFRGELQTNQGGILYVDETELEEKIVEIQAMARDARQKERLESKANGLDDNVDDDVKTGIEKEVESRLVKLRKRLQDSHEKSPVSSSNYLSKDGKVENGVNEGGLDAKEANGALMFKKKYKFRSPTINPSNKPKGFQGSGDLSVTKMKNSSSVSSNDILRSGSNDNNGVDLLDKDQQLDLPNGNFQGIVSMPFEEDGGKKATMNETKSMQTTRKKFGKEKGRKKLGKGMGVQKAELRIGIGQESSHKRPLDKPVKSGDSSKHEANNSQSFTKENHDSTATFNKHDILGRNGSLKGVRDGIKQSANKVGNKMLDTHADLWWSSLPYVLAILMRRGHGGEGPQGLFTLKSTSHNKRDVSHTIAFEDRGDATNFCYLLQSCFEDLDDFSTDIVPLSIKELEEAVKAHTMKVLVVKKGQLQLYAGQPLADVEIALHSLVGES